VLPRVALPFPRTSGPTPTQHAATIWNHTSTSSTASSGRTASSTPTPSEASSGCWRTRAPTSSSSTSARPGTSTCARRLEADAYKQHGRGCGMAPFPASCDGGSIWAVSSLVRKITCLGSHRWRVTFSFES
jgi:transglutaminase/protease-like cytokinesis protein 3